MSLREQLHQAGIRYDGHVTNGSLEEQVKVIRAFLKSVRAEIKTNADFGTFEDPEAYPETIVCEIIERMEKDALL